MSAPDSTPPATLNALGQPVGPDIAIDFPRPAPDGSPLRGQYCELVRLDPAQHGRALFEAFGKDTDGRNWTYLPYGPFADMGSFSAWLEGAHSGKDPLFYTILNADGDPVGVASYLRIDPNMGTIEVGHIHYSLLMQRTPVATEAMFLMMSHAFDTLGYRRYEWKCDALNAPSRAAAERLGFRFEGIFRKASHYKGRNRDTAWFAIVDDDWPARKQAFREWLAPDNFTPDGQQIRSLGDIARQVEGDRVSHE